MGELDGEGWVGISKLLNKLPNKYLSLTSFLEEPKALLLGESLATKNETW